MRALHKAHLQPTYAEARLLDAFALRLQTVSLRVIDHAPPLRNLIGVGVGVGKADTPLGNQSLDQLLCLRLSSACDRQLTVRRQAAPSARGLAPSSRFRRRRRSGGRPVNTDVCNLRIINRNKGGSHTGPEGRRPRHGAPCPSCSWA